MNACQSDLPLFLISCIDHMIVCVDFYSAFSALICGVFSEHLKTYNTSLKYKEQQTQE